VLQSNNDRPDVRQQGGGGFAEGISSAFSQHPYAIAIAILVAHVVLSTVFALSLPVWESYDEPAHYEYARFIALNDRLPKVGEPWPDYQEFHQPPLYYWLMSWVVKPIDLNDGVRYRFVWTPIFAGAPDPRLDTYPWTGTALANRAMRLATVLLSAVAVFATFLASLVLFPRNYKMALIAMSVHAFWPMYVFSSGTINNDNMIAWCGSFVSLFSYGLLTGSDRPKLPNALCYMGLVFSWFLAILSKDSAIALTTTSALVLIVYASRLDKKNVLQKAFRLLLCAGAFVPLGALALFISEGRSLRQFQAVSYLVNVGAAQAVAIGSTGSTQGFTSFTRTAVQFLESAKALLRSFFGVFARSGFGLPDAWYDIAGILGVCILAGVIVGSLQKSRRLPIIIAAMNLAIIAAVPVARALSAGQPTAANGRFALSGMTALGILVAVGVTAFPRKLSAVIACVTVPGLFLASFLAPMTVIRPLYARPLLYAGDAGTFQAPNPRPIRYGNEIELVGFVPLQQRSALGSSIDFFAYWRPLEPITKSYALRIEVFGSDGESFGVLQEQIPGRGSFPTTQWKPGDVYGEGFRTDVYGRVNVPAIARFRLSWVDVGTGELLAAKCEEGACQPLVGEIPVELDTSTARRWSELPSQADFGTVASLLGVAAAPVADNQGMTSVSITLTWRSLATSPPNTVALVHIVDAAGRLIAQRDDPPRHVKYPMWAWRKNEIIPEVRVIEIPSGTPAGEYRVLVGMYDPTTRDRLPLATSQSDRAKDSIYYGAAFQIP